MTLPDTTTLKLRQDGPFLHVTLDRPDVLPTGDLGVRNAAMRAYGLERPPGPAELQALAEPWLAQGRENGGAWLTRLLTANLPFAGAFTAGLLLGLRARV